jgi:two-component system, chemotaxis family, response regulator Rcp1
MPPPMPIQPLEILLVEDNPGDVRLIQEALREARSRHKLRVVQDGVEAMSYLRKLTPYVASARPDLILLDLNLPKKDGREVLAEIKSDPGLRRIPVVVLTTSDAPDDISRSYDLFANCYVAKPASLSQLVSTVQAIENFWLSTVTLPPR